MHCIISKRATAIIKNELSRFPDTETGGLLLGNSKAGKEIVILEATDSGYQNSIHEVSCFQYDVAYEEHVCQLLSQLYQPPLQLVGVWHKHNSVHLGGDTPFSYADENIHHQLMENGYACVSILFEKSSEKSKDVFYKTSGYLLSADGKHQNITDKMIWNTTPDAWIL